MENHKVSVIVPTYNRFNQLLQAIKSVETQTHTNIEIIVINDASTQSEYYSHDFGKVNIIHLSENTNKIFGFSSPGYVRNKGIEAATGDYIAFLDDDDIWLPTKLEVQLARMELTKCRMSCSEGYYDFDKYVKHKRYKLMNREYYYREIQSIFQSKGFRLEEFPDIWNKGFALIHNSIVTSSVVVTSELIKKVGGFNALPIGQEDPDLWARLLNETDGVYVGEIPLFFFQGRRV